MTKIEFAHLRDRSANGGWINYAVFNAKSRAGNSTDNQALLGTLTARARASGLRVDQSALAFKQNGRIQFYGNRNLVRFLSQNFRHISWTHSLSI